MGKPGQNHTTKTSRRTAGTKCIGLFPMLSCRDVSTWLEESDYPEYDTERADEILSGTEGLSEEEAIRYITITW